MWFYISDYLFIAILNSHWSGVLTVLTWLGPHETAAISACSMYTIQPCHFIQSHIHKVHVCLAVTCHLHFWQKDRDFLGATAVIRGEGGGGMDTKVSQHRIPALGEHISAKSLVEMETARAVKWWNWDSRDREPDPEIGAVAMERDPLSRFSAAWGLSVLLLGHPGQRPDRSDRYRCGNGRYSWGHLLRSGIPSVEQSDRTYVWVGLACMTLTDWSAACWWWWCFRSIKAPSAKRNPNAQVVRRGFLYRLVSLLLAAWLAYWLT